MVQYVMCGGAIVDLGCHLNCVPFRAKLKQVCHTVSSSTVRLRGLLVLVPLRVRAGRGYKGRCDKVLSVLAVPVGTKTMCVYLSYRIFNLNTCG